MDSLIHTVSAGGTLPQRRHRKMLKDGSSEVWPQEAEDIFLEGLRDYWNSPWANTSRGRSRWRNQYLVDYLKKYGIDRSKKQVASHIQVLRNMWKGHPEFALVAGPEAISEGSSTSDKYSPSHRNSELASRSPTSRRRNTSISHPSPPSTPTSNGSEYSDSALGDTRRPHSLHLSPSMTSQQQPVKSEHALSPQSLLFELTGLPSVPEVALEQSSPMSLNHTVGFCLWAQNIEPIYIDIDALPFVDKPTSPGSPIPPQGPNSGTSRACLRFTLRLPTEGSGCEALGFSGAITFSRPLAPSARVVTRVHVNNVPVSQEVQPLVPVRDQATATRPGQAGQDRYVAMLPDSCLSRCNLLSTNGKKTRIIQQVIVDAEPLFVVGYDLYRLPVPTLSAELASWTKVVDNRPPPEPSLDPLPLSAGRYGSGGSANDYLYSTAGSLPAHSPPPRQLSHSHNLGHARGHSVGGATIGHSVPPASALGHAPISASAPSGSSQTTPTHTNFGSLGSPSSPTGALSASSSGSSTARSRSGFNQGMGGMGMDIAPGSSFPMGPHGNGNGNGNGNGHGSMMGTDNFGQDPWTTSLLPLF